MSSVRGFVAALLATLFLTPAVAFAGPEELKFEIDGYYRARWHLFTNLFDRDFPKNGAADVSVYYVENPDPGDDDPSIPPAYAEQWRAGNPGGDTNEMVQAYCREIDALQPDDAQVCRRSIHDPGVSTWFVQRGRFEPTLTWRTIKAKVTIDVFDNTVWGDNENLSATPLFSARPTNTQVNGDVADSIAVRRLWVEWRTALGLVRIGRQPSNFGLGLIVNDGDGFKNDFGDAYEGTVFDRIVFATRPISVAKGIHAIATGGPRPKPEDDPGLIFAVGFDKLVESSSITFQRELTDNTDIRDENNPDGNFRTSPFWLSDRGDDVYQMLLVLMLQRNNWDLGNGNIMDLTVGTSWINRRQIESNSNVWIADFYLDWKMRGVFAQMEFYFIFGTTEAIAPAWGKVTRARIPGIVGRLGYENGPVKALVEVGHASGDDTITDDDFTGRALHRDYNVGLILYEQVLAQRTVEKFVGNPDTQGLWSNGGVYNSTYLNPRVTLSPADFFELRLGFLMAWAHQVDGAVIPRIGDESDETDIFESRLLGTEFDIGLHTKWADDHILFGVEMGYMRAGPRLARMSQYANPSDPTVNSPLEYTQAQYDAIQRRLENLFTLQIRMAFVF